MLSTVNFLSWKDREVEALIECNDFEDFTFYVHEITIDGVTYYPSHLRQWYLQNIIAKHFDVAEHFSELYYEKQNTYDYEHD